MQEQQLSFCNPEGEIHERTLIVGDNGTGKSTVLQAIVLLIAGVTRKNFDLKGLDWPGFEYRHLQTGRMPLKLEADILFDDQEIKATYDFAKQLKDEKIIKTLPSTEQKLTLFLNYDQQKIIVGGRNRAFFQFSGYQFAKQLAARTPDKSRLFENVGNIYWYNEQRTSYSLSQVLDEHDQPQIDSLRGFLASAYNYHLAIKNEGRQIREGEFDFYEKLENLYKSVFPGNRFVGSTPRFDIFEQASVPDFYLYDGKNEYEISGMSAGERAIFPILMDFARWNINNSIIIIDEIELHLHPPLQQLLVRALPKLGNNNQFILTTHSDAVASMFDEEENEIIRLKS